MLPREEAGGRGSGCQARHQHSIEVEKTRCDKPSFFTGSSAHRAAKRRVAPQSGAIFQHVWVRGAKAPCLLDSLRRIAPQSGALRRRAAQFFNMCG
jgi:hypothetical protein